MNSQTCMHSMHLRVLACTCTILWDITACKLPHKFPSAQGSSPTGYLFSVSVHILLLSISVCEVCTEAQGYCSANRRHDHHEWHRHAPEYWCWYVQSSCSQIFKLSSVQASLKTLIMHPLQSLFSKTLSMTTLSLAPRLLNFFFTIHCSQCQVFCSYCRIQFNSPGLYQHSHRLPTEPNPEWSNFKYASLQ